ncbi:MAG: DUF4350 domain-containing protein [Lysobacteraceae bacterium]|nr:MAG: DUF4350 domain-containing protein [Xanthomonadaceae bacterium]
MSRARIGLLALLAMVVVGLLVAWFLSNYTRVEREVPLPPRGEAGYNPLYALKLALRADGQRVESRQRLQLDTVRLRPGDTVVVFSDPRMLAAGELDTLFGFAERGGHLVLRLPPWNYGDEAANAGALADWLPIAPALLEPHCMALDVPGQKPHEEFCNTPRFQLAKDTRVDIRTRASWRNFDDEHVFARFEWGAGQVDLLSGLDLLDNRQLRDGPHHLFARQLLAPNWGKGTIHLVYAADMPPLWRWLVAHAWMAWLPALLGLLAWLWMRAQRFGPLLPTPLPPRRSLMEHVEAGGEHLVRYGRMGVLHRALRDTVLARLRLRDPLAAALEGDTQAALVAARTGDTAVAIRAVLSTRPPATLAEFRQRIARLIDLRKRL